MNKEELYRGIGELNEELLERSEKAVKKLPAGNTQQGEMAAKKNRKTRRRKGWLWAAAGAGLVTAVVIAGMMFLNRGGLLTLPGGIIRDYKQFHLSSGEMAIEWPWEYLTVTEKYGTMMMDGVQYRGLGQLVSGERLGAPMGQCEALGYGHSQDDPRNTKEYRLTCEVRAVTGMNPERMVAVELEGEYYLFTNHDYAPQLTFGEVLDDYSLSENLEFNWFSVHDEQHDGDYFQLTEGDDVIWQQLKNCREAAFTEPEGWHRSDRNYISFTATSDMLGAYKKVVYVTEDGYFWTNVFGYAYLYDIGEEAAGAIITYAMEHAEAAEPEGYMNSIAGTLTEIGDGYILVDDTVVCENKKEGMVFTVSTEDIQVRRCVEYGKLAVGDIVVVEFRGEIDQEADNLVSGVQSVNKGVLSDGNVLVPE